ncbi:MAG: hypothetical protein KAH04_01990 [Psychrilyobacter sp.]|nr:hypothetical protein [Psychrilyobacter sp.]
MKLLGKEINVEHDFNKKQKLLLITLIGVLVTVIIGTVLMSVSLAGLAEKKGQLEKVKKNVVRSEEDVERTKARYTVMARDRDKQIEVLQGLLDEFETQLFEDDAEFKVMIQAFLDETNIELLEIGQTNSDIVVGNGVYRRKIIPYRVIGKGSDIAMLFFLLEHSKSLLTIKENRIEVIVKNFEPVEEGEDDKNLNLERMVEVKFKIGFYSLISGGSVGGVGND